MRREKPVTFARAVYCSGVDAWYVRFGREHGVDVMFMRRSEEDAKTVARLINQSLNRDLKRAAKQARKQNDENT